MPREVADDAPLVFNPLDPDFISDPYPFYHRLRQLAPVFESPFGYWVLSRHEDVAFALRDPRFGKNFESVIKRRYDASVLDEPAMASLSRTMLVLDPPDHTRIRALTVKAFTARRVEAMRPRIKMLVDEQLDRVIETGAMDVIHDLAHRLPVLVMCDMLGIPEEHRDPFLQGSTVSSRLFDPVTMTRQELDRANELTLMRHSYYERLCALRRHEPRDDLTTDLVQAEEAGDRLSTAELFANIDLLFGAGQKTTTDLIGNGLLALHRHLDQWERLKSMPSLVPGAVEELLRFDSPVQVGGRFIHAEVAIGDVVLPAGASVVMLLGAANRDPARYRVPDRLDIERQNVRPISFGGGMHHCLGAQIARLEAELVFSGLIERLPGLELTEKDTPEWSPSFTLRGLKRLPAVWRQAPV